MDNTTKILNKISMTSFNCKSIKRSIQNVRELSKSTDLIALQETWLLPHDLNFINEVNEELGSFAKSSVDTGAGILKVRPYGGLAILWRKAVFRDVTVVNCHSDRLAGVKIKSGESEFLLINVYMPIDCDDNLPEFTGVLAQIFAIVEESDIETVYILGDFNAHPGSRFGNELKLFCEDQDLKWKDLDIREYMTICA